MEAHVSPTMALIPCITRPPHPSHLLDLLGIFVANKDDDRVNVNAVETLNGMGSDIQEAVTILIIKKEFVTGG